MKLKNLFITLTLFLLINACTSLKEKKAPNYKGTLGEKIYVSPSRFFAVTPPFKMYLINVQDKAAVSNISNESVEFIYDQHWFNLGIYSVEILKIQQNEMQKITTNWKEYSTEKITKYINDYVLYQGIIRGGFDCDARVINNRKAYQCTAHAFLDSMGLKNKEKWQEFYSINDFDALDFYMNQGIWAVKSEIICTLILFENKYLGVVFYADKKNFKDPSEKIIPGDKYKIFVNSLNVYN